LAVNNIVHTRAQRIVAAAATLALAACAAQPPVQTNRLSLWITDTLAARGNAADACYLPANAAAPALPPANADTRITEHDVESYARDTARWSLDPKRIPASVARDRLLDRCFVLAIDGRVVSGGVVLSSHSARLTGGPTIFVYERGGRIMLELLSSGHGPNMRHPLMPELDRIFAAKPAPNTAVR
jgi:hypothetical protein